MSEPTLLPCPFCESPCIQIGIRAMPHHRAYFQVVCRNCGATGPIKEDRYQAINAWCDRAPQPKEQQS